MGLLTDIYDRYQTNKRAEQLGGLMTQYQGQPITMGIQHPDQPSQGPGGLLDQNQQLPAQFYNRAMTIPGYEQFGLNQQQNAAREQEQAIRLAQQQAQWQGGQQQQASQFDRRMGQQQSQFEGVSGNQQAVIDAQQGRWQQEQDALASLPPPAPGPAFLERGGKIPTDYQLTPDGTGIEVIPQSKTDVVQRAEIDQYQSALEVIDDQLQFLGQYGDYESGGAAKKLDARARQILIPAMSKIYGSGVLNEGERDAYMQELHQFNALSSIPGMENAARAKMEALQQMMQRKLEDTMAGQGRQIPGPP